MKRLTFGVSAFSFAAHMATWQNVLHYVKSNPQDAKVLLDTFYVNDGLMGDDSTEKAIWLQIHLQELFHLEGFLLQRWR